MGALLGKAACRYVYGKKSPAKISPLTVNGASMSATSVSSVIATSEKGSGVLLTQVEKPVTSNLTTFRRHSEQYLATKKEAIITTACAFGNSFTLPLVIIFPTHLFSLRLLVSLVLINHPYTRAFYVGGLFI